jgi:Holliday junction resolvase RusA-like endonuclease
LSDDVAFTVFGAAEPTGSKLPGRRKDGKLFVRDDNPNAAEWKRRVAGEAGKAMGGRELLAGPLRMRLTFVVVRPGGHFTSKGALSAEGRRRPYPDKRPDLTKLIRGVEDAMTSVVWRDDEQVVQQEASKVYGEPARCEVEVEPAWPFRPYEGDPQMRLERLDGAIGYELAAGVYRDEQLRSVLRMLMGQDYCRCGALFDPLARSCPRCGRATFTPYVRSRRAAGVLPAVENPQIAESA